MPRKTEKRDSWKAVQSEIRCSGCTSCEGSMSCFGFIAQELPERACYHCRLGEIESGIVTAWLDKQYKRLLRQRKK